MPLNLANDVRITGHALPETFVHLELVAQFKPFLDNQYDDAENDPATFRFRSALDAF